MTFKNITLRILAGVGIMLFFIIASLTDESWDIIFGWFL